MMRKVSNNGVNAINSLKSKILIFFSFRRGTPVSFLNNKRFSARYFPVNRCFGLLWILNYFSGSGCCLGVLHHQEPGIQGGDKLLWDYKKFSNSYLFQVAWVRVETQTILTMNEHVITRNHRIKVNNNINDGILSQSNWWIVNVIKVNIKWSNCQSIWCDYLERCLIPSQQSGGWTSAKWRGETPAGTCVRWARC